MTCYLIKRMRSTPITNGEEITTQRIKIQNVTSVSVSQLGIYTITTADGASGYDSNDYVLNVIG